MVPPMKIDASGIAFIACNEGCILHARWDGTGFAIGYGHHGPEVTVSTVWTPQQCDYALESDSAKIAYQVSSLIRVKLTQGQFNVLVDFAYNIGVSAFASSSVLESVNCCEFSNVADELSRWVYSDHQISQGLIARRKVEANLWSASSQETNQVSPEVTA